MRRRGRGWRQLPRDLTTPIAVTLVAFGLAGCPGRNNDTEAGADVVPTTEGGMDVQQDVQTPMDASDASDVQTPMDVQDVQTPMDVQDARPDAPTDGPTDAPTDTPTDTPTDVPGDTSDAAVMDPTPTMVRKIIDCNTTCRKPMDAVMNSTGTTAYFTAFDPTIGVGGSAAVFSVPVAGGTITRLAGGGLLNYPVSIAISDDDATLFIADMAADRSATDTGNGAVFSLPVAGGMVTRINVGTQIIGPSGIAVDGSNLVLAGRVRMGTTVTEAIFRAPVTGGTATILSMDNNLNDPSDIAVGAPNVYRVVGTGRGIATGRYSNVTTTVAALSNGFVTSFPAGIGATRDGAHVLITGWQPGATQRLTWLNSDGTAPAMSMPVGAMGMVSPTGVGRARNAPSFVVADENAGLMGNGAIFEVR